ncbi:MOSC domain-containing protein [Thalassotalea maritima]|uniref:MOSC domain-containing protein n=1 Tax=Thalassotalea maritima TaxID=3242416 RepID=UPI003528AF38
MILQDIYSYPLKSGKGQRQQQAFISERGVPFDRYFVITDNNGKFITGRTKANMVHIECQLLTINNDDYVRFQAPNMPALQLKLDAFSEHYSPVKVWQDTIDAQHVGSEADQWFAQFLATQCRLYFLGTHSSRQVQGYQNQLSFADGYPILLIGDGSLHDLNSRLNKPVSMSQFRPNLVIADCPAFAEDDWQEIKIGEVHFAIAKPCSRCIFTTVNSKTGERDEHKEPLTTLASYRRADNGDINFGQNLVPLNQGVIHQGEPLKVIR